MYFSLQIGELEKATFNVVEFTLDEALSELFTLTVKAASAKSDIELDEQLLQKAVLQIVVDGTIKRTINGIVEEARRDDIGFKQTYYCFKIRPEMLTGIIIDDYIHRWVIYSPLTTANKLPLILLYEKGLPFQY